jgi:enoyl-CoA hydratase/carnithine racemase
MTEKCVEIQTDGAVGWVLLNRPDKLNALNAIVFKEIKKALTEFEQSSEIRVVAIKGNGNVFAAGADIDEMAKGNVEFAVQQSEATRRIQEKLANFTKPTVACISGYALGGGMELALCCDFRIASHEAKLGLPEIKLGIIPGGGGTQRLTRLVGLGNATALVLLGKMITADEAKQIGLVNEVCAEGELDAAASELIGQLVKRPPIAIRAAKMALRIGYNTALSEGLFCEQSLFAMLFDTKDQKEGMSAFLNKRKADFTGK